MCWFLYGGVNSEADTEDLLALYDMGYKFQATTKSLVRKSFYAGDGVFRLTAGHCDCESVIGNGIADDPEIIELSEAICALQGVRGIKSVYLLFNLIGAPIKRSQQVSLLDIDLLSFLAKMQSGYLYEIRL